MSGFQAMQQSWQVLREQSRRGSYARRRVGAVSAAGLFFVGLLVVFGLGRLLLLAVGAVVVLAAAAAGARLLRRLRPWRHLPAVGEQAVRELRAARARVSRPALLDTGAAAARRRAQSLVVVVGKNGRELRPRLQRLWAQVGERLVAQARQFRVARPEAAAVDPGREAVELNVHGTRLRREGDYEQAAQQHQAALEIFRELGDRRGEALTLNNVALAEGRAGDEETAVAHFEEALAILRELADREYEAQVTANLGLTLRRHGHPDRARELLETALEQLEPESTAARQVEVELRRAS